MGGLALFVAGAISLLGIITAEALYPGDYATGANEISDLGGTRPPEGLVLQPSAAIFDATMILIGVLTIVGGVFVWRAFGRPVIAVPIVILGSAAVAVGVFPGPTGGPHAVAALVLFVSGGAAAISASRTVAGPFRIVSILLGAISLVALSTTLVLGDASPLAGLGIGGVERWVAYPIVLWLAGFGGYLAGRADDHDDRLRMV
jgi:hypothetical membrane protein